MERTKRTNPMNESENGFLFPSVIGGLIGMGVTVALLLILPFAVLGFEDSDSLVLPSVCLCVLVGTAVGGFLAVLKCRDNALVSALTSFATVVMPIILISIFVSGEVSIASVIGVVLSALAGNGLAALAVTRFSKSKKRKMKNVMKRR
jgi:hypothetical protein